MECLKDMSKKKERHNGIKFFSFSELFSNADYSSCNVGRAVFVLSFRRQILFYLFVL